MFLMKLGILTHMVNLSRRLKGTIKIFKALQYRKDISNTSISNNSSTARHVKRSDEEETMLPLPKGGSLAPDQDEDDAVTKPKEEPSAVKISSEVKNRDNQSSVTEAQVEKQDAQKVANISTKPPEGNQSKKSYTKPQVVLPVRPKKVPQNGDSQSSKFSITSLKGKTTVGDVYEKGFTTPHEELCPNNGRDLKVLILITTAPDHEAHRNAVRQTWGHFALRKDVSLGFMVGRTLRGDVQTVIDKENERYGDIIEANFIDHYSNLTYKTVSMLEWIKTYCSEAHFILKTDDDMFINVPLLLAFIHTKQNENNAMYGRLAKGWKPVRNRKSKYYVDIATYWRVRYPDFLTGPAYLFTNDVVEMLYNKVISTVFFFLEDVLLTGFVAESLKIRRIGDSHFRNEKVKLSDTCKLMQTISIHMVKYEEQFDIYKRTLDGKTKCRR